MSNEKNTSNKYTEDFKRSIVTLKENGKTFSQLEREYGVSYSALSKWCKLYSTVTTDEGQVLSMLQIKDMQKRMAQLEEENVILKKAAALFMVPSDRK